MKNSSFGIFTSNGTFPPLSNWKLRYITQHHKCNSVTLQLLKIAVTLSNPVTVTPLLPHPANLSIDSSDPRSHLSDQRGLQLEAVPVVHLHVPVVHCQHDLTVVGLKICGNIIANINGVGMESIHYTDNREKYPSLGKVQLGIPVYPLLRSKEHFMQNV